MNSITAKITDEQVNAFILWMLVYGIPPNNHDFMTAWGVEMSELPATDAFLDHIIKASFELGWSQARTPEGFRETTVTPRDLAVLNDMLSEWEPMEAHGRLLDLGYRPYLAPCNRPGSKISNTWIRYRPQHEAPGYPRDIGLELVDPPYVYIIQTADGVVQRDPPRLYISGFESGLAVDVKALTNRNPPLQVEPSPAVNTAPRAALIEQMLTLFDQPLSVEACEGRLCVILEEEFPAALGDLLAARRMEGRRLRPHPSKPLFRSAVLDLIHEAEALSVAMGSRSVTHGEQIPSFDGMIPGSERAADDDAPAS